MKSMNRFLTFIALVSSAACLAQERFLFSDSAVMARLTHDMYILASDSFSGRQSGSSGEEKSYRYIIGNFRESGLTPHGMGDSSFLQPFAIEGVTIRRGLNSMKIDGYSGTVVVQAGFSPTAYSSNGQAEGKKYLLVDLARFNDQKDSPSSLRKVIRDAFQAGNSMVILYNDHLMQSPEADSLYNRRKVKPEQGLVVSVNDEIGAYLLKHPGVNISLKVDVQHNRTINHNVIGFIDNHAPYTIIIGAHYDHLGISKRGKVFNGADDNASGTVSLLELARHIKQAGARTNNYLFIAFSGEEDGLLGSGYFADHPVIELKSVNFMLNLDMVGRLGCEGNLVTVFGAGTSPSWQAMYKETAHPAFRLYTMNGVHSFTDHLAFYKQGIPIISLTTGFHYEYHTTRDDPETINYRGMVDLVKYIEALLHYAASKERTGFHRVSDWSNFNANLRISIKGIDHLLTVGMEQ